MTDDGLLEEQIAYYRARAAEYEDWWHRRNQHDLGLEANETWFAEMADARARLDELAPFGDVLELAGGTGVFTEQLAHQADSVTTVDASPESLAINRTRLAEAGLSGRVTHVHADLFAWRPERRYDTVFFGFWMSHVPDHRWQGFWQTVDDALAPGGHVFVIDNAKATVTEAGRPGVEVDLDADTATFRASSVDYAAGVAVRHLEDGRQFRIVKRGWTDGQLRDDLAALGWDAQVRSTGWAFIWAHVRRAPGGAQGDST